MTQNTLFYGDSLPILRDFVSDESVDLIYLDPPFNSNRSYNVLFKVETDPFTMVDRAGRPRKIPMAISAGVVGCDPNAGGLPQLVTRADEALYAAKQAGRNRVIVGDAKG